MAKDGSGGGTTVSVTPGTIARMAGNIAAGLVGRSRYFDGVGCPLVDLISRDSIAIARSIVERMGLGGGEE